MPIGSIIALCTVIGAFIVFAGFLIYGDLTWQKRSSDRTRRRQP